jgi:hypothetical protein
MAARLVGANDTYVLPIAFNLSCVNLIKLDLPTPPGPVKKYDLFDLIILLTSGLKLLYYTSGV